MKLTLKKIFNHYKKYRLFLLAVSLGISTNAVSQTTSQNYVKSTTLKDPLTDEANIASVTDYSKIEQINYLDGLGRTTQSIVKKSSPGNSYDVVQPYIYDKYGRAAINYLAYADVSADGSYKANPVASQAAFYNSAYRTAHSLSPYSETVFENSPLSRVTEQSMPGADWQLGSTHTNKISVRTNTLNEVRQFVISGSNCTGSAFYAAKTLYVSQVTDANGAIVLSYTDAEGHPVLKKVLQSGTTYSYTYFVYNDLGQLAYVISPKAIELMNTASNYSVAALTQDLVYQYKYDERGRVIEKKVPGKDWEYIVYNAKDQPVLIQDGAMAAQKKWRFVKYDALERPIMTGIFDATNVSTYQTRAGAQTQANSYTVLYEKTSGVDYSDNFGYTNTSFPSLYMYVDIQTVNYYDNYDFNQDGTDDYAYNSASLPCFNFPYQTGPRQYIYLSCNGVNNVVTTRTRGLATGSKIKVLDPTNTVQWINTANFYDEKNQIIQSQNNDFLGGTDLFNLGYDFEGHVTYSNLKHTESNATVTTILNNYLYDKMGRLSQVEQKNNLDEAVVISTRKFNELGQLIEKNLHSAAPYNITPVYLQSMDFAYNIRGWLTNINNADLLNDQGLYNAAEFTLNETKKIQSVAIDSLKITFTQVGSTLITAKYNIKKTIKYIDNTTQAITYTTYASTVTQNLISSTNSLYSATVPTTAAPFNYSYSSTAIAGENDIGTLFSQITTNLSAYLTARGISNSGVNSIIYNNITLTIGNLARNIITNDDANDAWGEELKYNTVSTIPGVVKQYGGNVAEKHWKSANDDIKRAYSYTYDLMNRMTSGSSTEWDNLTAQWVNNNRFTENVAYDVNGNISTLSRNGYLSNSTFGQMDNLTYQYDGNKLTSVLDASTLNGFNDFNDNGHVSTNEVTYDLSGNMLTDANKGITLTYNHLNLPTKIQFTNGDKIEYVYDATGNRLKKKATTAASSVTNTYYTGAFVFNDSGLEYITGAEGRLVPTGVASGARTFQYEYHIKDHTGNVALAFCDLNNNGVFDKAAEIIQVTHYYPFGMQQFGLSTPAIGVQSKLKFGDKELQDEFSLNQYDFGARFYDPATARFNSLDPLAEMSYDWTPYRYAFNNPLSYADPTGMREQPKLIPIQGCGDWGSDLIGRSGGNSGGGYQNWGTGYGTYGGHGGSSIEGLSNNAWQDVTNLWNSTPDGTDRTYYYDKNPITGQLGYYGGSFDYNKFHITFKNGIGQCSSLSIVPFVPSSGEDSFWNGFVSGIPGIGSSLESGDKLAAGDYLGATAAFGMALFDVFTLGGATESKLAVKTGTRAFFSGVGTETKAIEAGFQTLGQTRAGQNLQKLIDSRNIPWSEAEPMWQRLSATWAAGVPKGSIVPVFLNNPRVDAVWFKTELPILLQNGVNIIKK